MGVNIYNSAGYVDPTAFEALKNIEKEDKMKRQKEKKQKHKAKNYVHFDKSNQTGGVR